MKYYLLAILLIGGTAWSDSSSEEVALRKFETEEFLNEKNYSPTQPGMSPNLNKFYYDKLMSDSASLKYFTVLSVQYKVRSKYKSDKAFALSLESKFKGSKLKDPEMTKVMNMVRDIVSADSKSMHEKALLNGATFQEYYKTVLVKLSQSNFK